MIYCLLLFTFFNLVALYIYYMYINKLIKGAYIYMFSLLCTITTLTYDKKEQLTSVC